MTQATAPTPLHPSDGDLLTAFAEHRQAEAISQLVHRHGGMVLGVCRSVLGNVPDAEDAAQAVFLAMIEKAGSLQRHPTIAGWLYRVAWYVAANARRAASVRGRHEREAARMKRQQTESAGRDDPSPELLHVALSSLPEKYRLALVLHHLEGRTQEETAALLGCSTTAAAVRLTRGRRMLRDRLDRAGGAASAEAVLASLATGASAVAPAAFVTSMTHMAAAMAAGQTASAVAPAAAAALSKGALHMLFVAKMKIAAMVTAAVLLAGGAVTTTCLLAAGDKPRKDAAPVQKDGTPQGTSIDGAVVALDADKGTITVNIRRKDLGKEVVERDFALSKNVKVTLMASKTKDQQPEGKLSDVTVEAPVTLQLADDEVTVVAIAVHARSGNYAIKSVDPIKRTIVVVSKGKGGMVESTFDVPEDARISVPDPREKGKAESRDLADLTEGTPVQLQLSPKNGKTVMDITVQPRSVSAVVESVDDGQNTITISLDGKQQTLTLSPGARIVISDGQTQQDGKLSDLVGAKVQLQLSASDQKTITGIWLKKGMDGGRAAESLRSDRPRPAAEDLPRARLPDLRQPGPQLRRPPLQGGRDRADEGLMTAASEHHALFTIGHSTQELPAFLDRLSRNGITAVADVRSQPFSQFNPQFNRDVLATALKARGLRYVFMGEELGARRSEPQCYANGKARYELIRQSPLFLAGLDRVRSAVPAYRIALMCAEKDPITCHRMILVCRQLRSDALAIRHILEDGQTETNEQAEIRLLALMGLPSADLFRTRGQLVEEAYDLQAERIAFVESSPAAAT